MVSCHRSLRISSSALCTRQTRQAQAHQIYLGPSLWLKHEFYKIPSFVLQNSMGNGELVLDSENPMVSLWLKHEFYSILSFVLQNSMGNGELVLDSENPTSPRGMQYAFVVG
ncbi:uncharacterized protein LOC127771968 [Oryza glaberrima]|uniref:uncharacterized protein LOC127771968 n=1 Tax=Oryza glaberrima TaxID=4538 RepID=UPI00224C3EC6|nr:uncharacterized protein LOC127771968 [Oryza glaberrima]